MTEENYDDKSNLDDEEFKFDNEELKALALTIKKIELEEIQERYLLARLLGQIDYMDKKANRCKTDHLRSRKFAILGGVIVTALVGLSAFTNDIKILEIAAFLASQAVTVSTALEQLHKNNELWLFYRRSAEVIKSQLWQLLEFSGPYEGLDKNVAFKILVKQAEEIIPRDLDILAAQTSQGQNQSSNLSTGLEQPSSGESVNKQ